VRVTRWHDGDRERRGAPVLRRCLIVVLAVVLTGCQRRGPARAADAAPPAPPPLRPPPLVDAAPAVISLARARGIGAWQAVIERARLLARRDARGVLVGRLGGAAGPYRWLVDEDEGAGMLAIRVDLPPYARALGPGSLVQVDGAWVVDGARRWVWRATAVGLAVTAPAAPPPRFPPGLRVELADQPPDGAVPPSSARRRGGAIVFVVVAPPARAGDGWLIADTPGGPPTAWLRLPGERAIYGGQDLRSPEERWPLRVGERYTVEVLRAGRPRGPQRLRGVRAAGPPRALR